MDLSFLSSFFMLFILPSLQLNKSTEASNTNYTTCKKEFFCGGVKLTYPFYDGDNHPDYCGYPEFKLSCNNNQSQIFLSSSKIYHLMKMNSTSHTITVSRNDYGNGYCPQKLPDDDLILNWNLFNLTSVNENVTFYYGCDPSKALPWMANLQFSCPGLYPQSNLDTGYFMTTTLKAKNGDIPQGVCKAIISVPFNESVVRSVSNINGLQAAFSSGFELKYYADNDKCDECRKLGGECGWDAGKDEFNCYCPDGISDSICSKAQYFTGSTKSKTLLLGTIVAASAIGTGIFIFFICYFRRKSSSDNQDDCCMVLQANQDVEAFLRAHGPLPLKRYRYTDLKKVTNSFKEKLGEGGYGTVYKGKLHNGYLVAVKLLKKSKGDAKEFINEVASIGRTNHVNVVTLLGFCIHGQKKALIYDYMPNGSLEKFIYRKDNHQKLAWEKIFQIAVGIARGLEYLHRGCNTRILHFDIKPHNILLDENFCPKISDFGLAKSCTQNDSIISMSGARGTVGFIAPEVFLRSFGGVSYKSDVYSFGMLVLEMVGCTKKATHEVELSSDEYFPQWIYKELEQGVEVDHQVILNGEDKTLQKKLILVSLWCIQTNPLSRPTMTRVVEMLEGSIVSLQHPPVRSLSSPLMSMPNSLIVDTISLSQ